MANTAWWVCASCGHFNRPRPYPRDVTHDADGNAKCEQCGKLETSDAIDYDPRP